jgi:hypothetical protein
MSGESKKWFLARGGEKLGPFASEQLKEMGRAGQITGDMLVWREGMDNWQPVTKVRGLQVTATIPDPPAPPQQPAITVAVVPSPSAAPMPVRGHVTIEKTSKSLKLQQLLGLACILSGLVIVAAAASAKEPGSQEPNPAITVGSLLFVGGLVWRIVTRLRIWWHHG